MRVLFDENVPGFPASQSHPSSRFRVYSGAWLGSTSEWIAVESGRSKTGFNVIITADQNIKYQQNLSGRKIAMVVLGSNRWPHVRTTFERDRLCRRPIGSVEGSYHLSSKSSYRPRPRTISALIDKNDIPMPPATPILNAQSLAKSFGATTLFRGILVHRQ